MVDILVKKRHVFVTVLKHRQASAPCRRQMDRWWNLGETWRKVWQGFWKSPRYFPPCFSTSELIRYQISPPNSIKYRHQTLFFGDWGGRQRLYAQLKANPMSSAPPPPPTALPEALTVMAVTMTATVIAAGAATTTTAAAVVIVTTVDTLHTTHNNQLKAAAEDAGAAAAATRGQRRRRRRPRAR
jgi:hypothetical protein